ncbi:MAG TPA: hypothetical protein VNY33_09600 [Gaiellaceae bacterium]|jgi:hypothetical protein|nr:hypothetical protein [Gaiellaceae bacterium]
MARKSTADTAKDKAAKQKKIVIGLAVFLVLAVAYAVNTMSGLTAPPAASRPQAVAAGSAAPPTGPSGASTTPAPAAPSLAGPAPVASTPAPTGSTSAPASTDSSQLVSVVMPKADPGQLQSFSQFESKDPFAKALSSPTTSGTGTTGKTKGSSGSPPATPPTPPAPPAPAPTTAVISVNGTSESVTSGKDFPVANPIPTTDGLFQLISLTARTATITIVGGSYASGSQTLTLKVNQPVTLVNTADGTRYTLVLYPQGTVAPAAAAGAGGSSAPGAASAPTTTSPSGP